VAGKVEGVSGVSLPMLIRALTYRNEPLATVLEKCSAQHANAPFAWSASPSMPSAEAEIVNKLGLHARASAKLTQLASSFGARSGSRAAAGA